MSFNPFGSLGAKVSMALLAVCLITLVPALVITRDKLENAKTTIAELLDWRSGIVESIKQASDNDNVDHKNANEVVRNLGETRVALKNSVATQNAAIESLEKNTVAAVKAAEKARRERAAAIAKTENLSIELKERAKTAAANTDQAIRITQNELYEAGL